MSDRARLWALWTAFALGLALLLAAPRFLPVRPQPWHQAQAAVASFVLAIFSLTAGVSTLAGREGLRDVRSAPAALERLFTIWLRCLLIGVFGCVLAWGAASPRAAWPFVAGGAALLLIHAPRARS